MTINKTNAAGDPFGFFVGLSGSYAVVGAPQDDDAGSNAGSAYTFVASGGGSGLQTTTIVYSYDPLYRLTGANYTGGITAAYSYVYDSVGNMTAYTETVGANTTSVTRTFDQANRLLNSVENGSSITGYGYDDNGNLVFIDPPDGNDAVYYSYNQRSLLTEARVTMNQITIAEYLYDGDGNRVQQVDYTGAQPVTTTYANDNIGLSQVLIASSGITQTANLFGLDLILQDDGSQTRTLLTDGLGSVRMEMAAGSIETVTTYEPYGNVLTQTGSSNTTYAFTGEQFDGSTGLLYLRARYYNPNLHLFMGRDPWRGSVWRPGSQNGYNYVGGNPVNYVDFTGKWAWSSQDSILQEANGQSNSLTTNAVHRRIQAKLGVIYSSQWHTEYPIPGTPSYRIDILNSNLGEIWEIKPRYLETLAQTQVMRYRAAMNMARGNLHGPTPVGGSYNWNHSPQQWILGQFRFPAKEFLGTDPSGWVNIYYGQTQPGIVVWWKEKRQTQEVRNPINLPDWVVWNEKNFYPSLSPVPVPVPAPQPIPPATPIPPGTPGRLPQPSPWPVPAPQSYSYSTPTPFCSLNDSDTSNTAIVAGGTAVSIYIVYRLVRIALSPLCGPAAPLCALSP